MKIALDTDIGSDIDDVLALLLLVHLPGVELLGVTTVYGQVDVRAKVAKRLLEAAGVDAAVVAGESQPIFSPMPVWHAGTEGVGALTPEELAAPLGNFGIRRGADEFLIDAIDSHPGEVTLVSLGALTNVARAVRRRPDIAGKLKACYFMGGGVTYPDPVPERLVASTRYRAMPSHNIRCDVGGAQTVFRSPLPIHVLTNDVTTQLWWEGGPVQQLVAAERPLENQLAGRLLEVWLEYRTRIFEYPVSGTCPHDPATIAEASGHSFVNYIAGTITVVNDGSTMFTPGPGGRHQVGVQVEGERFLAWFSERALRRQPGCLAKSTGIA